MNAFETSGSADRTPDRFAPGSRTPEETAELERQFRASCADASTLWLSLMPTYECNCRCPYCYETDKRRPAGTMSADVQDAVLRFAARRFAEAPFTTLSVEWYGGEPSLCLDIVQALSARLISWCEGNGVSYTASMLSNGVRLAESGAAELLAQARVSSVLLTVDGPRETHNARRPCPGTPDPFEAVMLAIGNLQHAGISARCMMNTDRVNAPQFDELASDLRKRFGIEPFQAKLNDYAHTFGQAGFAYPDFDLFTHEEFARFEARCFANAPLSSAAKAAHLDGMLQPAPFFCHGQKFNYFVVDPIGDVYKCDGWVGDTARRLFNILTDEPVLDAISHDPFQDAECRSCELLELCWGNCSWERERCGMPCHPLKYALEDYRACLR